MNTKNVAQDDRQHDPDIATMSAEQWERAIAHAEKAGGELHADLAKLARRFDNEHGAVGHGVATSLIMLGLAARHSRSSFEVQAQAGDLIKGLAAAAFHTRMSSEAVSAAAGQEAES